MKFGRWLWFAAFIAVWCALRVFWLDADPGVPSMWEYGYNATDEGYYLAGGKEKYLWGYFVDLARTEAFTYGFSTLTHWLSYLAHLLFGLSTWTWRLPFFAICLAAWSAMFCHVAKRTGAGTAFALCASLSCMPIFVAYERTASNDVLIGSLLVLSYVIAAGKTRWRIVAAGVLSGMIVLVKPSVFVLVPIVLAGVLEDRPIVGSLRSIALFVVSVAASVLACKGLQLLSVMPDAARAGVSAMEIVKRTTTHYPLPSILDFGSHFRGLSSFPRDPSIQLLGVAASLISAVPLAFAVRNVLFGRWNGHLLLFLAIPAYVAAVSVMNTIYTHYFLPVLFMLPVVFSVAVNELSVSETEEAPDWKKLGVTFAVALALCLVGIVFLAGYAVAPAECQNFYSRIYNLPSRNVWCMTGVAMAIFAGAVTAVIAFMRNFRAGRVSFLAWFFISLVVASTVFAALPAATLAPFVKQRSETYFAPMTVSLVVSVMFLMAVFGCRCRLPWRRIACVVVPCMVLACYVATPVWRSAFMELVRPGTHLHEKMAAELRTLLPDDAVVIGERSNQMLMSLPIRTATTFAANSDPIPVVESVLKSNPAAKLYALADSQHAYNLQHYKEHAKEYRLDLVKEFKMPSFGNGLPASVYLCRIVPLRKPVATSPVAKQ